jgi:predicted O-linked N-acetylglucosamine transferase (SPINDLY family)
VAENEEQYVEKAVFLAKNRGKLAEIREEIERSRTTNALFDTKRYVLNLEDAFLQISEKFRNGEDFASVYPRDVGPQ